MSMQFLAKRPTDSHRSRGDIWTIYQGNTDITGSADYCHISGAPVVAIKYNGVFYPRVPELDETYGSVTVRSRRELQMAWVEYEKKVNFDELIKLVVNCGINPYFWLLKDTTLPSVEDRVRNPFGGFPGSAFHDGITIHMLRRWHARLLEAKVRLGSIADDNFVSGHVATDQEYAAAALNAVDRMQKRAFAKREPLPPGTLRCLREAQLWWMPQIYTGSAAAIEAKPAPKLLTGPKIVHAQIDHWL